MQYFTKKVGKLCEEFPEQAQFYQTVTQKQEHAMQYLQEGDIIELGIGHTVYADVPKRLAYQNCPGEETLTHTVVSIAGELASLAGRYVVAHTMGHAEGLGHGGAETYAGGYHVWCERLTDGLRVDFYQSGSFRLALLPDIQPVGKAVRRWEEIAKREGTC